MLRRYILDRTIIMGYNWFNLNGKGKHKYDLLYSLLSSVEVFSKIKLCVCIPLCTWFIVKICPYYFVIWNWICSETFSWTTFAQGKGNVSRSSKTFPSAARRMDTLNDLLAASDLISLHCALTNETVQIINADTLQHIKPGIPRSFFITSFVIHFFILFFLINVDLLFFNTQGHFLWIRVAVSCWMIVLWSSFWLMAP